MNELNDVLLLMHTTFKRIAYKTKAYKNSKTNGKIANAEWPRRVRH